MSQILTNALATYKAQQEAAGQPVILDQIVFAYVPGIDPEAPIDPDSTLPPEEQIVYRYDIPSQNKGFINPDAVVYSCLLGTDIGTWTYNSIYLINSELNLAGSIITTPDQVKVAADPTSGIEGDTLVRNIVTTYANAQELTQITVAAEVWQLDFTLRLAAMDERVRQINLDEYGHASFFEDGWKVTHTAGATSATVQPGVGYVGGLKSVLETMQTIDLTGITLPKAVYLVSTFQGQANSAWETTSEIRVETNLDEIFTENGFTYYAAPLAKITSIADAEDWRQMNKETDFVRISNAATNNDIDTESTEEKHINLPQLWRAFTNKISSLLDGTSKNKAASEWALAQVNKKAEDAYSPENLPNYTNVQHINLTHLSDALFYPIVLEPQKSVGYGFYLELASTGGSSSIKYNSSTLAGYIRGGGYSDYAAMWDFNFDIFDESEVTIHSIWEGTTGFMGIVIYLRGGKSYTSRVNTTIKVIESGSYEYGGSTFQAAVSEPSPSVVTNASNIVPLTISGNYNNQNIFNAQNPPTPEQVGAVNVEGDEMGKLVVKDEGATPLKVLRTNGSTNVNVELTATGKPSVFYGSHTDGQAFAVGFAGNLSDAQYRWFNITSSEMTLPGGAQLKTANITNKNTRIVTKYGYVDIGATNTSYCHFSTDSPEFYFSKPLRINGEIYCGTGYNYQVFHDNRLPYELAVGNRAASNFKDARFVPFTTTAPNTGYPGNYGSGIFSPRISGGSYYGWGMWNETTSTAVYFMKQRSDGSGFTFDQLFSKNHPPTATEVGALQWKKVASGSCSIAWKNSTRETFMETINTNYKTGLTGREHNSGRFRVKILSKGGTNSSDPDNCWWSYRGEPREVTPWTGSPYVVIDVYAAGAALSAGTGGTEWELWELQAL